MAGADDCVQISLWGRRKLAWLRRFLPFGSGGPSHDTLNDVMNALMRLRTKHRPANTGLIRHTALNTFKSITSRISLKNQGKLAALG